MQVFDFTGFGGLLLANHRLELISTNQRRTITRGSCSLEEMRMMERVLQARRRCVRALPLARDLDVFTRTGLRQRRFNCQAWDASHAISSREKGLAFEARVERVMRTMDCTLAPTQLSMDGGIDHVGRWTLPDMTLDVVTQCKNEQKPVGVQYLREFYGVLGLHASPSTLALFFSSSGFSIYAQRFFTRTLHPAVLCTIDHNDRIVEFLLNDRARAVLPQLSVGTCFVEHQHELILTYGDRVLGS